MELRCITIAREYASGGSLIGKKLAESLGIAFYDKELIALTAKQTGFTEAIVEKTEREKTHSLLFELSAAVQTPLEDQIFLAQFQVIQEIAGRESCVIVGRCADYVLRTYPNCRRVFIHAPLEARIARAVTAYGVDAENAEAVVRREDRKRAAYYNRCTNRKWHDAHNYHLCIDSSIGLDESVELIAQMEKGMA